MTTINTWAGTAGRIAGRAWRTLVWIESQIDWHEVGHIVWHGLLAFAVGVYVAGEFTGRWVHRTSARLARLWVQLMVRRRRQLALPPARVIEPTPQSVHVFAIAAVPARCGIRRLAAEPTTTNMAPPAGWQHITDPMARAVRMVQIDGRPQRLAAKLCGVSRSSLQRALKAA